MAVGCFVVLTAVILVAPPTSAGRRVVAGQVVETSPNWGQSFSVVSRFGFSHGQGRSAVAAPPKPKAPELRQKFLVNKFSVNPWTFQITPTHDLWLQQPFPLR